MKPKRWKRRNRHKNTELFNAFISLEKMTFRSGRYISTDTDSTIIIKRVGSKWAFLPFPYKPIAIA
jgi:hypothetical protein